VPVKNLDGFENAITRLEQMSRRLEMIESAPSWGVSVGAPGDDGARQSMLIQHFYLP
jgi:hypothetical protein